MAERKPRSASGRTFESIQDDIMTGRFPPGGRLRELHLARRFGVSQSTIREALLHLEHTGLVVRVPNRGTTVTSFTKKELRERVEVRLILEEEAFVKASQRHSRKLIKDLEAIISRPSDANNKFEHSQSELDFHRRVWKEARNEALYSALEQVTAPLFAYAGLLAAKEGRKLSEFATGHRPLVELFRDGASPSVVRAAIRNHVVRLQGGFFRLGAHNVLSPPRTEREEA